MAGGPRSVRAGRSRVDRLRGTLLRLLAEPDRPPFRLIGSWRGAGDMVLPHVLYVAAYAITGSLPTAIGSAVVPAALVTVYRLARRQPFWQAVTGLGTIVASGLLAAATGTPEGFFLPAIIRSVALSVALLTTIVIRWPLVGMLVGPLLGQRLAWRGDRRSMRAYQACTAVWAGRDVLVSVAQVGFYVTGNLVGLAIVQVLGWPLFAVTLYLWWTILHRTWAVQGSGRPEPRGARGRRSARRHASGSPPASQGRPS
ncbi:MAG TPA: DUF3159 domain-containing protein [Streptosporangiaceae bacterium]|jgi:hypothetical protein